MIQKTLQIILQISLYSVVVSCAPKSESTAQVSQIIEDSTTTSTLTNSADVISDTVESAASRLESATTTSELLSFIQDFIRAEFSRSRQDLIDQNTENGYTVSEVRQSGRSSSFELDFKEFQASQIFMCTPDMGETTISFIGEPTVVKNFFDQAKLSQSWDRKDTSKSGEGLEKRERWKGKPIVTHITMTYTENGNEATFLTRRQLIIEN